MNSTEPCRLWFAKMISDAKSLGISDIHIDVRAWEGKACNIVIRCYTVFSAARGDFRQAQGLVHHSDQGTQYMRAEYLRTLRKHGMISSVGRPASPGDNASCEYQDLAPITCFQ
jgi:transposase InsO family protein